VPNGAGVTANFLTSPTSSSSISLDAPITVGSIVFSIANNVTLNPGSGGLSITHKYRRMLGAESRVI
jgi:hypothetical protein